MAKISVDDLQEGMELSEAVMDQNGQLLLPEGAEVTAREIRLLSMWGVMQVSVDGADDAPCEELDPAAVTAAEQELAETFMHADLGHPFVESLHRYCVRKLARARAG